MSKAATSAAHEIWKMNFWHRVNKEPFPPNHWMWMGGRTSTPNCPIYGISPYRGDPYKFRLTHRIAYELVNGIELSRTDRLYNICGEPLCCNPEHWDLNQSPKLRLQKNRGRHSTNEKMERNIAIVKERQAFPNRSMAIIGKKYGITRQAVEQILRRYRAQSGEGK